MDGIVYWTAYICMHTTSVFEELGEHTHVIIACKSKEYGTFGSLNLRNVEIKLIKDKSDVDLLISKTRDYVHINAALKPYKEIEDLGYALRSLLKNHLMVMALNVEAFQWWGVKGILRRIQWFYLYNIGIGRKIKAIGCTGITGILAHRKAFISQNRLFDFIYSVPAPNSYLLEDHSTESFDVGMNAENHDVVRFVYVGQIIPRKCILDVVRVFNSIASKYRFDIIGGGPQEDHLKRLIEANGSIHYWGKIKPDQVRNILKQTDVLILSSQLEGWGCTVNEALMYGNKVIVSDAVGSKALIQNRDFCGQIFKSGDWNELKNCIEHEISQGIPSAQLKQRIANWAQCIYPSAEADYLLNIINYYTTGESLKPIAPWQ